MIEAASEQSTSPIALDATASALVSISMRLDKKSIANEQVCTRKKLRAEAKAARAQLRTETRETRAPITAASRALTARAKAQANQIASALKQAISQSDNAIVAKFKCGHIVAANANQLAIQVAARDRAASGVV